MQKPAYSDPAGGQFLIRHQRIRSDRNVCAIVRHDGLFHVESETGARVDVSEGILDANEMDDLKAALNNKDLAELSQQEIAVPLLITDRDEFLVSILRSPLTQKLTFPDRESRRPYDDFINPLLHWMDALQHHEHTNLGEFEGRNNCLPPKKLELSLRPDAQPAAEAPSSPEKKSSPTSGSASLPTAPQQDAFLMRWEVNHIARGTVQDTCVIVYLSGQYRMERSTQGYHEKLKLLAFEDVLVSADLQELETLLNQPELKSSTHRNFPQGQAFQEGELTTLNVSREGGVQQLAFASYFGVPGWVSNVGSGTDREERLVKPVRRWVKEHVEARKTPPLQNPIRTRCLTQPRGTPPSQ